MTGAGGQGHDAEAAVFGRRFRPDVEGLRAIAVVVVIAFHAGVERLGGGFVGVDVFFVISGFLITGLIVGELDRSGRLTLAGFYSRRFRRILPAAAVVFAFCLLVVRLALSPLDRHDLSLDAVFTALYAMNIREIITDSDYLRDPATSPFLHYWSLAVEEQFYLVWPLLMVGLAALARRVRAGRHVVLTVGIGVLAAVSFVVCVWLTAAHPVWGFFLLGSRAWELAVGGLLAVSVPRLARIPGPVAAVGGWVGLGLIGASVLVFTESMSFPGWRAAVPVAGTALVIVAGCVQPRGGPEVVLGLAPMLVIGRLSFSLYLWHWPILIALEDRPGLERLVITVVALAVLAPLTYLLVENPVRRAPRLAAPPIRGIALGGALTVLMLVAIPVIAPPAQLDSGRPAPEPKATIGEAVQVPTGPPPPAEHVPSDLAPPLDRALGALEDLNEDGCLAGTSSTEVVECTYGDPDGTREIVLFGDSHAFHWLPALDQLGRDQGVRITTMTRAACPWPEVTVARRGGRCDLWRDDALARIAERDPDAVVLGMTREGDLPGAATPAASDRLWSEGMAATLAALPDAGRAVLLGPSPRFAENVPRCLAENLEDPGACEEPREQVVDDDLIALQEQAAADAGATFVDVADLVCTRDPCEVLAWNLLLYTDENHLGAPWVRSQVPVLDAALAEAAGA